MGFMKIGYVIEDVHAGNYVEVEPSTGRVRQMQPGREDNHPMHATEDLEPDDEVQVDLQTGAVSKTQPEADGEIDPNDLTDGRHRFDVHYVVRKPHVYVEVQTGPAGTNNPGWLPFHFEVGRATCHPDDEFNFVIGFELALARAMKQFTKWLGSDAADRIGDAERERAQLESVERFLRSHSFSTTYRDIAEETAAAEIDRAVERIGRDRFLRMLWNKGLVKRRRLRVNWSDPSSVV